MSPQPGPITPKSEGGFFVGWQAAPPAVDRRFLLGAALGLVGAGVGAAAGLAAVQDRAGMGTWDQGDVRDFIGDLILNPYPAVRVRAQQNLDGTLRDGDNSPIPALLGCLGKCGVRPRLADMQSEAGPAQPAQVAVRGTLIQRGRHTMISVIDGPDWIRPAPADLAPAAPATPTGLVDLGPATLTGEILDAKCWYGAMRPAQGKAHKACAALCIISGLPPAFYARDARGRDHAFLLTDAEGGPLHAEIVPLVADPVRAQGRLVRRDFVEFRVDPDAIQRI